MQILINGKPYESNDDQRLESLVQELGYAEKSVAVVVDGKHVPRHRWSDHRISDGQCLEFVSPMQGG